jgi:HEAT repeat protein
MGKMGPAAKAVAVPALIEALKDDGKRSLRGGLWPFDDYDYGQYVDKSVRNSAAEALVKMGLAAVPALIEALKDENKNVRENATEICRPIAAVLCECL